MVAHPTSPRLSVKEFAVLEDAASVKHELINGRVVAMSGGTMEHAGLAAAVSFQLSLGLRGKPCRVFSSDLRVVVPDTGLVTYPDVTVVCGKPELHPDDLHATVNPSVIVEVLSDSTEAHDRGAKASHYRRLPSLKAYVLVSQNEPRIEVQRRTAEGRWEISEFVPGQNVEVMGVSFPVDAVYEDPLA